MKKEKSNFVLGSEVLKFLPDDYHPLLDSEIIQGGDVLLRSDGCCVRYPRLGRMVGKKVGRGRWYRRGAFTQGGTECHTSVNQTGTNLIPTLPS